MYYGNIKKCDIANGEGVRTTLFVSGCTHRCPECFQPETWDFSYGEPFTREVEDRIVERVKRELPDKTIWCYTGDVYEDLANPESPRHTDATDRLLACIDILVDGPYVAAQHDITLRFRGSSNQRIIDLGATRASGEVRLWQDDPLFATHTM